MLVNYDKGWGLLILCDLFCFNQIIFESYAWKFASIFGIWSTITSSRPFSLAQILSLCLNTYILGKLFQSYIT